MKCLVYYIYEEFYEECFLDGLRPNLHISELTYSEIVSWTPYVQGVSRLGERSRGHQAGGIYWIREDLSNKAKFTE